MPGRRDDLIELKYRVFTWYSRAQVPICAWCDVVDIDMLCLDHINNIGTKDRKVLGHSLRLYRSIIKLIEHGNAPLIYQILCANHNQKKEEVRKWLLKQEKLKKGSIPTPPRGYF